MDKLNGPRGADKLRAWVRDTLHIGKKSIPQPSADTFVTAPPAAAAEGFSAAGTHKLSQAIVDLEKDQVRRARITAHVFKLGPAGSRVPDMTRWYGAFGDAEVDRLSDKYEALESIGAAAAQQVDAAWQYTRQGPQNILSASEHTALVRLHTMLKNTLHSVEHDFKLLKQRTDEAQPVSMQLRLEDVDDSGRFLFVPKTPLYVDNPFTVGPRGLRIEKPIQTRNLQKLFRTYTSEIDGLRNQYLAPRLGELHVLRSSLDRLLGAHSDRSDAWPLADVTRWQESPDKVKAPAVGIRRQAFLSRPIELDLCDDAHVFVELSEAMWRGEFGRIDRKLSVFTKRAGKVLGAMDRVWADRQKDFMSGRIVIPRDIYEQIGPGASEVLFSIEALDRDRRSMRKLARLARSAVETQTGDEVLNIFGLPGRMLPAETPNQRQRVLESYVAFYDRFLQVDQDMGYARRLLVNIHKTIVTRANAGKPFMPPV